jgi:hypothetical protein
MPLFGGKLDQAAVGVVSLKDGDHEGGFRVFDDIAARDAIVADARARGMTVYVNSEDKMYRLLTPTNPGPPQSELDDNDNWSAVTRLVPDAVEALTYAASLAIDFDPSKETYKTLTLTGNITFSSSNLGAGRQASILLTDDGSARTRAFPVGWVFIGAAAPTAITAGKKAVLSLVSFGATDAEVAVAYSEQP